MVTVYQFQRFDITTGLWRTSRRWGTREAVERLGSCFSILEDTATEVSEAEIWIDVPGLTEIGFNPHSQGPQRQIHRAELSTSLAG